MSYSIRPYTKADIPQIIVLIKELAEFENATDQMKNTAELMEQEADYFHCLVVENEEKNIIGMALYYYCYYTWVGKSLYLDDLIVTAAHRGKGIGTLLLKKVIDTGKQANCKRIRWQVLDWNENAIALYEKMGAKIDKGWYNCDIQ
jgi:ribosomal protein S18 acetylase RimI-like enzyme